MGTLPLFVNLKIFTILPQLHVSHFISLSLTPVDCRSLMLEITQFQYVLSMNIFPHNQMQDQ